MYIFKQGGFYMILCTALHFPIKGFTENQIKHDWSVPGLQRAKSTPVQTQARTLSCPIMEVFPAYLLPQIGFVCIRSWSFCRVRGTKKEMFTWCFCCGIRTLFFAFIGLIIIHVDLTEMEGEASKALSDKADSFHSLRNPSCWCHHCTESAGCQHNLPW